jgi:NADH-quinone oxidoreductase subunit N
MSLTQQLRNITGSLGEFRPELWLFVGFVVLIITDLRSSRSSQSAAHQGRMYLLSLLILVLSGYLAWQQWFEQNDGFLFGRMLYLDAQAIFFKILAAAAAVVMLLHGLVMQRRWPGEYFALVVGMVLGLFVLSMAVNLLSIYVALEIVSITSYLFTAFEKRRSSSEAALKYLLFGAAASAVMLYGMSLLYGLTGTLNITEAGFSRQLAQADGMASTVCILLTVSGLLFKVSAVPFHPWNPDVYEAAPTPVVSFFSVAPNALAFLVLIRLLSIVPNDLRSLLAVVALASITVGNFSALWQHNAKRLLAYSGIAHAGFVLVGLAAFNELGLTGAVFYLATYLLMNMGAFLLIDMLSTDFTLKSYQGLGRQYPLVGVLVVVVMMALVGFPLTVGFTAKLFVFSALWETYLSTKQSLLLWLFGFGLLNMAVSLFYYLKIPFLLFFREIPETNSPLPNVTIAQQLLALGLVIPVIILFFGADWLMNLIGSL